MAARCGRQGRFASSTNAIDSKGALAGLRAGETGCGRTETGMGDGDVSGEQESVGFERGREEADCRAAGQAGEQTAGL